MPDASPGRPRQGRGAKIGRRSSGRYTSSWLFVSQNQIPYFLIVNRNFNYGAKPYVYFDDRVKRIVEISKNRLEPMAVDFEPSDGEKGTGILLKAGDGRLFRIQY